MIAYYLILFATIAFILYSYRAVYLVSYNWSNTWKRTFRITYLVITILIYATTSFLAVNRDQYLENNPTLRNYTIVGAITLSVTLLSICVFQLIADIYLLTAKSIRKKRPAKSDDISRKTFLNKLALGVGGVFLGSFLWGTTKGKFGWRVLRNTLSFDNLPKAFNGLKIVQISDLHLGSFNKNFGPIEEAIEMINDLNPDYIFFTGDLINKDPEEAKPWIEPLKKLKAKQGKYAILGNHDYGWGKIKEEEKDYNRKEVISINQQMGFRVLANEHEIIEKNGEKIALVGVENWGFSEENWFPTKGDYKKSVHGMANVPFKILLSHDPTHWDHHILGKEPVDLTLSGHTHGGQLGISVPGLLEISAAKLFYKRFAGLYKVGKQCLYVNRGMGFLIFPGRVGMPPEITLHELYTS